MPGQPARERMLAEYQEVLRELGSKVAPDEAASIMVDLLRKHRAELIRLAKERAEAVAKAAAKAAELARVKAEQEAAIARQKAEEAERVSQSTTATISRCEGISSPWAAWRTAIWRASPLWGGR